MIRTHKTLVCLAILFGYFSLCHSIVPNWMPIYEPELNELYERPLRRFGNECKLSDRGPCYYGEHANSENNCLKCLSGPGQKCTDSDDCGSDSEHIYVPCCMGKCHGCMTVSNEYKERCYLEPKLNCTDTSRTTHEECYGTTFCNYGKRKRVYENLARLSSHPRIENSHRILDVEY